MVHPWSTIPKQPETTCHTGRQDTDNVGVLAGAPGGTRNYAPRLGRERREMSTAHSGSQTVVSSLDRADRGLQPSHSVSTLRKPFGPPVVHGASVPRPLAPGAGGRCGPAPDSPG